VIGKLAIGVQTYINAGDAVVPGARRQAEPVEPIKKLPLCFIITPCSEYFEKFRHSVLTFAAGDSLASEVLHF
jgi:hypothetical protein